MPIMVQKYGGTSVADAERIKQVADRVRATRDAGYDLVVVVSAMGETTDRLASLASEVTSSPTPREMDMLLTAGERITMALLAMALHDRGIDAVSYTGSQAGILTDSSHGEARITRITGERVKESLAAGKVVIVAGFQGVDPESREVTTLGRGGSDTTAVALTASLGGEVCEILTDVRGVFTADPRVVPEAGLIDSIGYQDMLDLARAGAGVLMPASVEYAMTHDVAVHVRSALGEEPGTVVSSEGSPKDVVGIGRAIGATTSVLTIVGSRAHELIDAAVEAVIAADIEVIDSGSRGRGAFVEVAREHSEDTMRSIHDRLIGVRSK
ncbi:MAG: aspartate kinase [Acidimicrobiia bacterium]|nr:aspartate kinase [Acidimicrobiia bacterium]